MNSTQREGAQNRLPRSREHLRKAHGQFLPTPSDRVGKGARRLACNSPTLWYAPLPTLRTLPKRWTERAIEGPDHRAGGHGNNCDHQEKVRLGHRGPEAAEISGGEITDEVRGEPHTHHHGKMPDWCNLGYKRQSGRREVEFGGGDDDEKGKQPQPTRLAVPGLERRSRHDQIR